MLKEEKFLLRIRIIAKHKVKKIKENSEIFNFYLS